MSFDRLFVNQLDELNENGNYRIFRNIERKVGSFPNAKLHAKEKSRTISVWCSNDYLGMGQHPKTINAMRSALESCGAGAGGTRNISGTHRYHIELEAELAELHSKEAALLFTSGYVSNWAALSTIASRLENCIVFSDEKNHASMIEGIRHSRAKYVVFKHNSLRDLRMKLENANPDHPKLIAFESVYSMDGDISDIKGICDLADEFNALTYLDEVHAVGMYGPKGGGIAERDGVLDRVTIIEGTLGKAYGVMGGYITSTKIICDFVRSFASGFIFTTALPPAIAAGARASIRHLKTSSCERILQRKRVQQLRLALADHGIPYLHNNSHIIPVMVGDAKKCKHLSDKLLDQYNIYVQSINYPTVPIGTERLRFTPSPDHSIEEINYLANALSELWPQFALTKVGT